MKFDLKILLWSFKIENQVSTLNFFSFSKSAKTFSDSLTSLMKEKALGKTRKTTQSFCSAAFDVQNIY